MRALPSSRASVCSCGSRTPSTPLGWYGRGPVENYHDRQDGTPIGVWSTSVDEQFVDYLRPQDHGNHTDVRWVGLAGDDGGLIVTGDAQPSRPA